MIDPQRRLAVIIQSKKRLLNSELNPHRNRIQPILAAPRLVQNDLEPLDVFAFGVFDDAPRSTLQLISLDKELGYVAYIAGFGYGQRKADKGQGMWFWNAGVDDFGN